VFSAASPATNFVPPALNFTLSLTGGESLGRFPDDLARVVRRQGALGQPNATWTHSLVTGVCSHGYWYDFDTSSTCDTTVLGSQDGIVPDYPPMPASIIQRGQSVLCRSAAAPPYGTGGAFYAGQIVAGLEGSWVCETNDNSFQLLHVVNEDIRSAYPGSVPPPVVTSCTVDITPQGDSYCPTQISIGQKVLLYDSVSTYYQQDYVAGVYLAERYAVPTGAPSASPTLGLSASQNVPAPAPALRPLNGSKRRAQAWPSTAAPTTANATGFYSLSVTFKLNTPGQMRAAWGSSSTNALDQPPNLANKVMYPFLLASTYNNTNVGDFVLAKVPGSGVPPPVKYQGCAILSMENKTHVRCCQVGPQGPILPTCINAPIAGLLTICTANQFPVDPPGFGNHEPTAPPSVS